MPLALLWMRPVRGQPALTPDVGDGVSWWRSSPRTRKRGRVMGIVAAHRLKQMKEILLYNELAIWRRENGFDRVEAVEKNRFGDHRSLPPTLEQFYASLWAEVDELKVAISMPIRGGPSWQEYKRNIIRKIEQDEVSDEDFAVIK